MVRLLWCSGARPFSAGTRQFLGVGAAHRGRRVLNGSGKWRRRQTARPELPPHFRRPSLPDELPAQLQPAPDSLGECCGIVEILPPPPDDVPPFRSNVVFAQFLEVQGVLLAEGVLVALGVGPVFLGTIEFPDGPVFAPDEITPTQGGAETVPDDDLQIRHGKV